MTLWSKLSLSLNPNVVNFFGDGVLRLLPRAPELSELILLWRKLIICNGEPVEDRDAYALERFYQQMRYPPGQASNDVIVDFTPEACLNAVRDWLHNNFGFVPAKCEVIAVDGIPWLRFESLSKKNDAREHLPWLLSPLAKRPLRNPNKPRLADDVLLLQIHASDPTPNSYFQEVGGQRVVVTRTREPWATIAIVRGEGKLVVKEYTMVFPEWGVTAAWPFPMADE